MSRINLPHLFFWSGVSGLIYQVVWLRMLIRVSGVTLEAVSIILAVFMAGLAIGSIAAGRFVDRLRCPLKWYFIIEFGIAVSALVSTLLMKQFPVWMAALAPASQFSTLGISLIRIAISAATLLIPTILMGATLPLLTRQLASNREEAGQKLSRLYGLNTLGAMLGVLFSGFISIGQFGETNTVIIGIIINILIGTRVYLFVKANPKGRGSPIEKTGGEALSSFRAGAQCAACFASSRDSPDPHPTRESLPRDSHKWGRDKGRGENTGGGEGNLASSIALVLALSGFCALALEVLWSRVLILLLGNSVYAFSCMLSVYLAGIAAGSIYAERIIGNLKKPLLVLAKVEMIIAVWALAGFFLYNLFGLATLDAKYLYSPFAGPVDLFKMFFWTAIVIFPATFLMGFFFPVAVKTGIRDSRKIGFSVGSFYGYNTIGTIFGSLITGFWLIPLLGTKHSFILISALLILTGVFLAYLGKKRGAWQAKPSAFGEGLALWLCAPILLVVISFFIPDPVFHIINKRLAANMPGRVVFHKEDKAGTVTVHFSHNDTNRKLFINGLSVSGNGPAGKIMAHLPLLIQENPKNAFVIGLGAGNALYSAVVQGVKVDVAEIIPGVIKSIPYFLPDWDNLLKTGIVSIIPNDGRNHLLQSKKTYDAIIVDVTPPIYGAGAVNVYTTEFFKLCRSRLSDHGVFSLWIPLPCFKSDFWMIMRSLTGVFPHIKVWRFKGLAGFLVLSSKEALDINPGELRFRMKKRGVKKHMPEFSAQLIMRSQLGKKIQLDQTAKSYSELTDDRPYTEFPLVRFLTNSRMWK